MVICAVFKCTNRSVRNADVSYYSFPRIITNRGIKIQETSELRRKLWMLRISRADLNDENVQYKRVCSDHFVKGKPSDLMEITNPDWAPSINLGHNRFKSNVAVPSKRYERLRRNANWNVNDTMVNSEKQDISQKEKQFSKEKLDSLQNLREETHQNENISE